METKIIHTTYGDFDNADQLIADEIKSYPVEDGFAYEHCGRRGYRDTSYIEHEKPDKITIVIDPQAARIEDVDNMLQWFWWLDHQCDADIGTAHIKYGEGYYDGDLKKIIVPVERLEVEE